MSIKTGATSPETSLTNGGVDLTQTQVNEGAGRGQTVSLDEFQKAQSELTNFKKELASRDAKIAELQKMSEAKTQETLSLKSLEEQLHTERVERTRMEFALKNQVSDELLPYLSGSSQEELTNNWQALSQLIDKKAEEKIQVNHQKLSRLPAGSHTPPSDEDLIKRILESS